MQWVLLAFTVLILLIVGVYFIPIRYTGFYDERGAYAWLWIGFLRFQAYPDKPEKKEKKKDKRFEKKRSETTYGLFSEFADLVKRLFEFLSVFSERFTVKDLNVKLIVADGDPVNAVMNYGRAWALFGNLIPQLERFFNIKKRNIDVQCDFAATETKIYADFEVSIPLGRVFAVYSKYLKLKE